MSTDKTQIIVNTKTIEGFDESGLGQSSVRLTTDKSYSNNGIKLLIRGVNKEVAAALEKDDTLQNILLSNSEEIVENRIIEFIKSIVEIALNTKKQIVDLLKLGTTIEFEQSEFPNGVHGAGAVNLTLDVKNTDDQKVGTITINITGISAGFKSNIESYLQIGFDDILQKGGDVRAAIMPELLILMPTETFIQPPDES